MIVKIQVPLVTADPYPKALIYNKGKSVWITRGLEELPDHVLKIMSKEPKAFFHAKIVDDELEIGIAAPWQEW